MEAARTDSKYQVSYRSRNWMLQQCNNVSVYASSHVVSIQAAILCLSTFLQFSFSLCLLFLTCLSLFNYVFILLSIYFIPVFVSLYLLYFHPFCICLCFFIPLLYLMIFFRYLFTYHLVNIYVPFPLPLSFLSLCFSPCLSSFTFPFSR
jgi:hypothetical protein